jgi:hypothetical protein
MRANKPATFDEADQVFIKRSMPACRGKWRMVSEEVEQAAQSRNDE